VGPLVREPKPQPPAGRPAATQYGFTVTAAGLGVATYIVGSNGAAFGAPDHTPLTVMPIMLQANAQAVNGVLYEANTNRMAVSTERLAPERPLTGFALAPFSRFQPPA
jgi:hypothetical protein